MYIIVINHMIGIDHLITYARKNTRDISSETY